MFSWNFPYILLSNQNNEIKYPVKNLPDLSGAKYSLQGAVSKWFISLSTVKLTTTINFDEDFLYVNDFMGRRYSVDKNTGEIKSMRGTK